MGRTVINVVVLGYNRRVGRGSNGRRCGGTTGGAGFQKIRDRRQQMGWAIINIQGYDSGVGCSSGRHRG